MAAPAVFCPSAGAAPSGRVLVVGDSLEVLTSPYLKRYLHGIPITVNAVGGYNSYQIFELFQESYDPTQSVIVFDAGTNDNPAYPQILAGNLAKVAAIVGNRCMVVPTIHGFTVNGVNNDGKNRVVREFAASRPGTQVPEWAAWVHAHPQLMADQLHPGPEGADARAQLIAQGVLACLGGATTSSSSPSAPSGPALKSKPQPMQAPTKLASRQAELVRSVATELLAAALVVSLR
jgi:hypothetical protein